MRRKYFQEIREGQKSMSVSPSIPSILSKSLTASLFREIPRVPRAISGFSFRGFSRVSRAILFCGLIAAGCPAWAQKSEPDHAYLFPAGGQRGTRVTVQVAGENITSGCDFHFRPTAGVSAPKQTRERRLTVTLGTEAPLGVIPWRVSTTNGGTGSRGFVVGEYPESLEREPGVASGSAEPVKLPVTVNGRLNPRGDTDRFSFELQAGQRFYAEVLAARLGGPIDTNVFTGQFGNPPGDVTYKELDASLVIYGPDGAVVANAEDTFGLDPALGFKAPKAGRYVAEIHHLAHQGMPQFVYRLTLATGTLVEAVYPAGGRKGTSGSVSVVSSTYSPAGDGDAQVGDLRQTVKFDAVPDATEMPARLTTGEGGANIVALRVGDLPEALESEPNDAPEQANAATLPATLNGRFLTPGDTDTYRVTLRKGQLWRFDGWIERLGSPTDAVLSITDPGGKMLATNDDGVPGTKDPRLWFSAPADGDYLLQIREVGMSRLGERLVYRLDASIQLPDFEVEAGPEAADLSPGGSVEVNVTVRRLGGFAGPVEITTADLPAGLTAAPLTLAPNQDKGKLKITASAEARSGSGQIRIVGKGMAEGQELRRLASLPVTNPAQLSRGSAPRQREDLLVTVRYPVPFKIEADDSYVFMNLGTHYPAKVTLTRNPGFTAPITLSAADRQPRDPQGITFDRMEVADGKGVVFLPMHLPQGPRGNPIVRMHVKAEAVVKDGDGHEHYLLQTSVKQVVLRTQAPVFSMEVEPATLRTRPGTRVPVRLKLGRTATAAGAAEVRLQLPDGMRGISMEPVTVPAGQSEVDAFVNVAADATLDLEEPLWLEASTKRGDNGYIVFYRVPVELEIAAPKR